MKKIIITICLIVVAGAIYLIVKSPFNTVEVVNESETATTTVATTTLETAEEKALEQKNAPEVVIGKSVEDRDITAYRFGKGEKEILFVGGIHGGYSWNTALVAYEVMDYLKENPSVIPEGVKVTIIPVLNPDGLAKVTDKTGAFKVADVSKVQSEQVAGRFNGNTVDLNRNFDCDWKASGVWQSKTVSGGTKPFSEPESAAIRDYVEQNNITAVVAWYSSAGGVYASNCHNTNGVIKETTALTEAFAKASGYPAHKDFNFYEITGDMTNWFSKINIPAISVLLTNHTNTDWTKNKAGVEAILKYYSK